MTNTNKPWHTNYERIHVRVLSNISEIFAKKNHEYEQRKNAKIFVRAKSIACRLRFQIENLGSKRLILVLDLEQIVPI